MKVLHFFYPQSDLALASGNSNYTAPAVVRKIQKKFALLPAVYAAVGDIILLPRGLKAEDAMQLEHYEISQCKNITICLFTDLSQLDYEDIEIQPWGWSKALRNRMLQYGVPEQKLPTMQWIERLRMLSHRRLTISANLHHAFDVIRQIMPPIPLEFYDPDVAMHWIGQQDDVFLKAPWSSSGHGVFRLSKGAIPERYFAHRRQLAYEWLSGTIARQGSIMAETGLNKILDCATEWCITPDGEVRFKGWSVFKADENGHYTGQVDCSQAALRQVIYNNLKDSKIDIPMERIAEAQEQMLKELVQPFYHGPLGIDMLICKNRLVAPCLEINLRMTMGMAYIQNQS